MKVHSQDIDENLIPGESHHFSNESVRESFLALSTGKTAHTTL
jgi:hypothetical protein